MEIGFFSCIAAEEVQEALEGFKKTGMTLLAYCSILV